MLRRPIFWGVTIFSIAVLGWVVAVIVSVLTAGALAFMANVCGYIAIGSLPIAGFLELIKWVLSGEMEDEETSDRVLIPSPINHYAYLSKFRLRNFVSRSTYLDMPCAPTRFSLKILRGIDS